MIRLLIKGNMEQASAEALKRKLPIQMFDMAQNGGEVFADIDESYMLQVCQWFCESQVANGSFPPGTLLYYN